MDNLNLTDAHLTPATPLREPVPESLRSILESRCFEKSPALRTLLLFLWHRRYETTGEYEIAVEALGRRSLFDPRIDATVRVQISRLRQRLERFYQTEGLEFRERLVIPLGSHQIHVECISAFRPDHPLQSPALPARNNRFSLLAILTISCLILFAIVSVQSVRLSAVGTVPAGSALAKPAFFWQKFFGNGRSTRIVLPTPVFFAYRFRTNSPNGNIMVRDTDLNEFENGNQSEAIRMLTPILGATELAQNYTVTSDTFASIHLARYLDGFNLQTNVVSSADAPLAALDRENVIALGTWGTLAPLKPYLDGMDFVLTEHERFAENPHALPGEPARLGLSSLSHTRSVWPGVIALLPSHGTQTHLLILTSRHTSALVTFLTSSNNLEELERMWKSRGSPEFYEVIVAAEMEGDSVVRIWPVALHAHTKGF